MTDRAGVPAWECPRCGEPLRLRKGTFRCPGCDDVIHVAAVMPIGHDLADDIPKENQ